MRRRAAPERSTPRGRRRAAGLQIRSPGAAQGRSRVREVRTKENPMSTSLTRFLAPAVLAAGLGVAALAAPAPAQAQSDDLVRVLVNVAVVVMRGNQPYYRYGDYGYDDRLIVQRDRYGRPVYYRSVPRVAYRQGPPYGNAYGYHRNRGDMQRMKCNKHGKCKVEYYDSRYDRGRYGRHDHDDDRRYWRGRD
jgi:hypothetical protein